MTTDQFRVRVTVAVTDGNGGQGRRSSAVERMNEGDTLDHVKRFLVDEVVRLYVAARNEART